jgi:alpha-N-acetylglucosamine transferase
MMGDNYLAGVLMLAQSLIQCDPKLVQKIDLVCMVTPDVSDIAKKDILQIYSRIIETDYLEVPINYITHKNPHTAKIYSKAFTKINVLKECTDYDKIVYCDADMLILDRKFYNLFTLDTPAGVYLGCYKPFYDKEQYENYIREVCPKVKHGELIDPKYNFIKTCNYDKAALAKKAYYLGVESSIMVLKPSLKDYKDIRKKLDKIQPREYGGVMDSLFLSKSFEGRWHHIDIRFLGRWIWPADHPELVIFDMYGSEGKPWQVEKIEALKKYTDVKYWWQFYLKNYPKIIKSKMKHPSLIKLYDVLTKS